MARVEESDIGFNDFDSDISGNESFDLKLENEGSLLAPTEDQEETPTLTTNTDGTGVPEGETSSDVVSNLIAPDNKGQQTSTTGIVQAVYRDSDPQGSPMLQNGVYLPNNGVEPQVHKAQFFGDWFKDTAGGADFGLNIKRGGLSFKIAYRPEDLNTKGVEIIRAEVTAKIDKALPFLKKVGIDPQIAVRGFYFQDGVALDVGLKGSLKFKELIPDSVSKRVTQAIPESWKKAVGNNIPANVKDLIGKTYFSPEASGFIGGRVLVGKDSIKLQGVITGSQETKLGHEKLNPGGGFFGSTPAKTFYEFPIPDNLTVEGFDKAFQRGTNKSLVETYLTEHRPKITPGQDYVSVGGNAEIKELPSGAFIVKTTGQTARTGPTKGHSKTTYKVIGPEGRELAQPLIVHTNKYGQKTGFVNGTEV